MSNAPVASSLFSGLVLTAALVAACGSGSGGGHGSVPMGMAAFALRDGTLQSSDGRVVTSLFVEISRITIQSNGDGQHEDDEQENGDDHDGNDNQNGDDDHDGIEVVVFDMNRDNGGVPRVIDLLTLTNSGVLFNMLRIPVGVYDSAVVTLEGATALFEDDPTQTPVDLAIDGDSGSDFEFDFQPPVHVTTAATSLGAIDFVPVITLEGTGYTLSHDGDTDSSGECDDGEL